MNEQWNWFYVKVITNFGDRVRVVISKLSSKWRSLSEKTRGILRHYLNKERLSVDVSYLNWSIWWWDFSSDETLVPEWSVPDEGRLQIQIVPTIQFNKGPTMSWGNYSLKSNH